MPIAAKEGSAPIRKVETPIISSVSTSIFLRPTLSPKCPMMTAPIGRAT